MKKAITAIALASVLVLAGCGSSASSAASSDASASGQSDPAVSAESQQSAGQGDLRGTFDSEMFGASTFYDKVRNDKTGNWRCYVYNSDKPAQEIAADYWKAYAGSDDEVHALENLGLKTSANVTSSGGMLYVDVYEYVQGEEHDAEKMFTGTKLGSYLVNAESGEVEEL